MLHINIKADRIRKYKIRTLRLLLCMIGVGLISLLEYQCVFLKYLHIPCLGCGMTRAYRCVLAGELGEAFTYHRAFWTVPFILVFVWRDGYFVKNKAWNIAVIVFIVACFIENYMHHFW